MKNTIKWCAPRFNTSRMVAEYTRKFYNPSALKWDELTENAMNGQGAGAVEIRDSQCLG
jgi:hypothetical protein